MHAFYFFYKLGDGVIGLYPILSTKTDKKFLYQSRTSSSTYEGRMSGEMIFVRGKVFLFLG